jgi:hypothetical protein
MVLVKVALVNPQRRGSTCRQWNVFNRSVLNTLYVRPLFRAFLPELPESDAGADTETREHLDGGLPLGHCLGLTPGGARFVRTCRPSPRLRFRLIYSHSTLILIQGQTALSVSYCRLPTRPASQAMAQQSMACHLPSGSSMLLTPEILRGAHAVPAKE